MYQLMCKDDVLMTLKEDSDGNICDVENIEALEKLPFPLQKNPTIEGIMRWLEFRGIPKEREGFGELKQIIRLRSGKPIPNTSTYASLSDQFWLKKAGSKQEWKKINFFTNKYSSQLGDLMFAPWEYNGEKINTFSPEYTTNGMLKKAWVQQDNKVSKLYKAGSILMHQEPLSEVLATCLLEKLQVIPFVRYDLEVKGTSMCSVCENFITQDTELVPASHIYFMEKRDESTKVLTHLLRMAEKYDVPDVEEFMKWLIFVDHLTGNKDRNLGNIAFIKDVNTNKFIGPAPAFDNGTAYWNNNPADKSDKVIILEKETDAAIIREMKKKVDLSFLKRDDSFKKLINRYPLLEEKDKSKLINAIKRQYIQIQKQEPELTR